jgi:hypothetical protein
VTSTCGAVLSMSSTTESQAARRSLDGSPVQSAASTSVSVINTPVRSLWSSI